MRRLSERLIFCLLITALPFTARAEALRLGIEGGYAPFTVIGPDGKPSGFDIDIANAVCARIKAQCSYVQVEFEAMIPALRAKKIDAIVASMSITAERAKAVDFSQVYYESVARFIGRADGTFEISPAGLKGKRIGVQRTTIHDRFVTATFKDAVIQRYAKQEEIWLDLLAGRIDGTVVDNIAGSEGFLKTPAGKGYAFRGPEWNDPKFFGDGPGIAVRKGEQALRQRIDDALTAIVADGSYGKLAAKYFDFDVTPARLKKK